MNNFSKGALCILSGLLVVAFLTPKIALAKDLKPLSEKDMRKVTGKSQESNLKMVTSLVERVQETKSFKTLKERVDNRTEQKLLTRLQDQNTDFTLFPKEDIPELIPGGPIKAELAEAAFENPSAVGDIVTNPAFNESLDIAKEFASIFETPDNLNTNSATP